MTTSSQLQKRKASVFFVILANKYGITYLSFPQVVVAYLEAILTTSGFW